MAQDSSTVHAVFSRWSSGFSKTRTQSCAFELITCLNISEHVSSPNRVDIALGSHRGDRKESAGDGLEMRRGTYWIRTTSIGAHTVRFRIPEYRKIQDEEVGSTIERGGKGSQATLVLDGATGNVMGRHAPVSQYREVSQNTISWNDHARRWSGWLLKTNDGF